MLSDLVLREYTGEANKPPKMNFYSSETTDTISLGDLEECPPYSAKFEPTEGDLFAVVDEAGQLTLSSKTRRFPPKKQRLHDRAIYDLEWLFGHNSHSLLTASSDSSLQLVDAHTLQSLRHLRDHQQSVKHVSHHFSNDSLFYSCSNDGSVKLWDLRRPRASVWTVPRAHKQRSPTCVCSLGSSLLASCGSDGTVRLWDSRRTTPLSHVTPQPSSGLSYVVSSSDLLTLFVSSVRPFPGIHRMSLRPDRSLQLVSTFPDVSINSYFVRMCLSPDDSHILSGSSRNSAVILDAISGERRLTLLGHRGEVTAVDWSPSSLEILTASDDCSVTLWKSYSERDVPTDFVSLEPPCLEHSRVVECFSEWSDENAWRFFEGIEEAYGVCPRVEAVPFVQRKVVRMESWLNVKKVRNKRNNHKRGAKRTRTQSKRQPCVNSYFKVV